jgi:signal transduction histidine kinase
VNEPSVLIISDETEFARMLTARWQAERHVPAITVISSDLWRGSSSDGYELAIAGTVVSNAPQILSALNHSACAICVTEDRASASSLHARYPQLALIPREDGWLNTLILLAGEILRRREMAARAERAERVASESQSQAMLGRYMLEMRHSVNNALTSVLGNADLLLLEPGQLSAESRDQIKTIHTMALRLNEVMQRFSSLATEMRAGEKDSQAETLAASHMLAGDS